MSRRAVLRLALVAACGLAGGCSTWNPLVAVGIMSEPAHKPTPLAAITATVTPKPVWTEQAGKAAVVGFQPFVDGGKVYVASVDGTVSVLDLESGKVSSRTDTGKPLASGVEVGEGLVFVGTHKGEVVALDAAGKVKWTSFVGGEVIVPASVSRQIAVARTADGRIFGLAIADGKRKWVYQRPMPALLLRTGAGVRAIGGDVVAGYPNGKLIALDIEDGSLTWEVTVAQPRGATELERIADVAALPVIDGGNVCAAAFQGKVACFEIQSRNAVWSRDLSTSLGLAVDARSLYVVDDTGAVHALDKASGASIWKQEGLRWCKPTAPVVVAGLVVVGDGLGFLHALSTEDGRFVGRLATDGSAIVSLVPAAGGLVLQTAKGSVSLVRF